MGTTHGAAAGLNPVLDTAPVLGVVANSVKVRRGGKYGYGYYGGCYGRPAESAEVGAAEPAGEGEESSAQTRADA